MTCVSKQFLFCNELSYQLSEHDSIRFPRFKIVSLLKIPSAIKNNKEVSNLLPFYIIHLLDVKSSC